jgi:hypothetical protein
MVQRRFYIVAGMALIGLMVAQPRQARAQNNPPPLGAILDLAGDPITTDWTQYSVTFTALLANTDITFALRNDPAFIGLDNIMVTDTTTSSGNLILNGDFEGGTQTSGGNSAAPVDWTYDNVYGAGAGGVVTTGGSCPWGPESGSSLWCDGAIQSYDAIDQIIGTTIGDVYSINFFVSSDGSGDTSTGGNNFQDLSTNGNPGTSGNGIDLLVYAQGSIPVSGNTPEPASIMLIGTGLVGLGLLRRYKRS